MAGFRGGDSWGQWSWVWPGSRGGQLGASELGMAGVQRPTVVVPVSWGRDGWVQRLTVGCQ
ncbi:hypothetical protein DPMN_010323 [Dreissena polymorpha]|uniref:Uncharacterized protein n=1 Tax=Dreissena polymorpha TaxID=45954 RepID=A0A9D4RZ08_DREPO|nr:hypothetical protein DPMN_010323 [Dreissena polymorpha]